MYKLLFTSKKRKGIQAHVFDKKEEVVHLLYLDPRSLEPKEEIQPSLTNYLANMKKMIKEGKYMQQLDGLKKAL
ncbi:hypothetical protein ACFFHM_00730 [Halalkalibacter kiskunsagensis]|uniref:Uncharacterized protein n=1 Tax=Halalkalibacter kiskunsagensis TaxID=1548599 RepID=A0ABV6K748_9BACI